jgi:molybdopterin-containing oxidoreductase family iron-sulfur binding subunit
MGETSKIDISALRSKLAGKAGAAYWRSLEQLAETEQFQSFVHAEFPSQANALLDPVERRHFLKLMGASLALAGASACTRQPEEKIFPYVRAPEHIVPGKPLFFATAMPLAGVATGLLVESHMGRPTKVEGNADHAASLGATDCFAQASILGLYDPDRSQTILNAGNIRPWPAFVAEVAAAVEAQRERRGAGLRILTGTVTSPTLIAQIEDLLESLPEARWIQYESIDRSTIRTASRIAFGRELETRFRLDRAETILALDADFLTAGRGALRYARDFARRRRNGDNRLYAVEPCPSNTGAAADHRLPLDADLVEELAVAIAAGLGIEVREPTGVESHRRWIEAVTADLRQSGSKALVVAGEWQSTATHLLAHAINSQLGAVGRTVEFTEPIEADGRAGLTALRDLCESMKSGEVDMLVIAGANPVYDAPSDLDFVGHMQKVGLRIHLGLYDDETAEQCHWHIPETHFLESWSDARAYDGSVSIQQPMVAPLYDGKSIHELLAALAGKAKTSSYDLVRAYWRKRLPAPFEESWRQAVHDGVVKDSTFVAITPNWQSPPGSQLPARTERAGEGFEVVLRSDPSTYDGRFANNGWLQELPRPITRLTWDNAAWIAPAAAERLGVRNGDVVELTSDHGSLRVPVWIVPGQAPRSITLHLGYGRRRAGYVAAAAGVDANPLRTSASPWSVDGVRVRKTGETYALVCTQDHFSMEGRDLIRTEKVGSGERQDHHGGPAHDENISLYPDVPYEGYAWGMTIDLASCTGCNACVVSCQSENNIPIVGKDQVGNGREMHWLRIDRYFAGDLDAPEIVQQPVLCMQCEQAPCELVCPVNATNHSDEGLNDMVYNRCVGTRYCSNNCPYKVRRFNFFLYNDVQSDVLKMAANPDVTIRSRGVMEKCTYCVQRINHARINAKKEGRKIRDGEVVTACQAVCPTEAIVFGDTNDQNSNVSRSKKSSRNYTLLAELGTRPRTTYLSGIRNPNPALEDHEEA